MFDQPYPFDYLGPRETFVPDPIRKVLYRFKAEKRSYLVTFEIYSFDVVAVKYCGLKDRNAGNRFEKIYNDKDAFRVITTCLYIMLDYWRKNPDVTFSFYAVPRKFDESIVINKELSGRQLKKFIERYRKVRFAIYDYAMINLFPPTAFIALRDSKNAVYLLMNKKHKKPKITVQLFGRFLLDNYEMIFEPDDQ
jgi:hypothetical protein